VHHAQRHPVHRDRVAILGQALGVEIGVLPAVLQCKAARDRRTRRRFQGMRGR